MENCDVFISYRSDDSDSALEIQKNLEDAGISCNMAPDMGLDNLGDLSQITDAIKASRAFILILSEKTQASQWITKGLDYAISINKTILPFFVENCTLQGDYKFYLSDVQHYQAFNDKESSIKKLTNDIIKIIDQSNRSSEEIVDKSSLKKDRSKIKYISLAAAAILVCVLSVSLIFNRKEDVPKEVKWKIEEPTVTILTDDLESNSLVVTGSIKNTGNTNITLDSGSFEVKNADDETIINIEKNGSLVPNVLRPGETGYYYGIETIHDDYPTDLKAVPNLVIKESIDEGVRLKSFNVRFSRLKEDVYRIRTSVTNETDQTQNDFIAAVVFFDSNNQLVTILKLDDDFEIESGSTQRVFIEYTGTEIVDNDIKHCLVYLYKR